MARVDVIMPQMGESIAEGTVSRWLKKVGDSVKRDEPIFEISTDKVDAEIPSPSAGVLMEILVGEGMTVAVNTVVARLETDAAAAAAAPAPSAPVPAETATAIAATSVATPAPVAASAAPPAARPAVPATEPGSLEERLRTKSSPLVRKIAAEHGVEIASLSGTGIAGRVTRRDLDAFLANRPAAAAAAPAGVSMYAPAGTDTHGPLPTPWPGDVVEPMSKIRKLTSDHMATARRVAAHVTTFWEIDLTRVARLRNANAGPATVPDSSTIRWSAR